MLISVEQLQKWINLVPVNYKGSIVEECNVDAIVVDQLLILLSHLRFFGSIMFRRVSNEVVVTWKKFLKPAADLYSKSSQSTSSRIRSFIKSVVLYFFFAWKLGRTYNRCFRNLRTFSTLEIIIGAKAKSTSSSSLSDIFSHSDFKSCAKPIVISEIHKLSVNLNNNHSSRP